MDTLADWKNFVEEATDVFVAKNTDYDSRFTRALYHYDNFRGREAARTIWAWEVEKKLDRCRTWIARGQLLVKEEGVRNSVVDLFNYTVQYYIYCTQVAKGWTLDRALSRENFQAVALEKGPDYWLQYWPHESLISPEEDKLLDLLREEITGLPF